MWKILESNGSSSLYMFPGIISILLHRFDICASLVYLLIFRCRNLSGCSGNRPPRKKIVTTRTVSHFVCRIPSVPAPPSLLGAPSALSSRSVSCSPPPGSDSCPSHPWLRSREPPPPHWHEAIPCCPGLWDPFAPSTCVLRPPAQGA